MKRHPCRSLGKGALVSHRCHLHMLDLINENLGSENMQRLLSSQFGFLFPFPDILFQGQIFNIFLRHLEKESEQRNRLQFCIGGRMLEFTPRDFAVITGLRFGGWFEPPSESETHRVIFRRKQSISLDEIAAAFKAQCSESGGRSLNCLRLACLLIVFGVFITMGGSANHIELKFLHLIDDLDGYLRFPWGLVAYESLVKRAHRARDVVEKHMMKQKLIAFDANCFVLALQVWAYEVVPILGSNCASMSSGSQEQFPRLRRWTSSVAMKYSVLQGYFSKLNAHAFTPIMPTEIEVERLAELGFSKPLENAKVVLNNQKNVEVENGNLVNGFSKERHETLETGVKEQLCNLMQRVDELERTVQSLIPLIGAITGEMKNISKRIASAPHTEMFKACPTQKKLKQLPTCFVGSLPLESVMLGVSPERYHDASSELMAKSESRPLEGLNKKVNLYDPNEAGADAGIGHEFNAWRIASQKDPRMGRLMIPCKSVDLVKSEFFDTLWSRNGWLNTLQMDALINLLMLSSKQEPKLFQSGWTAMEMICWDVLRGTNDKILTERVSPYVVGDKPENNPVPWDIATHVYGVGNIGGDHWVSYVIDLDEKNITVFDSLSMTTTLDSLKTEFKQVRRNIELLCDRHDVWRKRKVNDTDKGKKWKVCRYKHPPQQTNNCDCGVLAIKYIECLVSRNSVAILDEGRCGFFRHSYCAKLFKLSKVMPDDSCKGISL